MRVCVECGRAYKPSSRHRECPACRSKDTCDCGRVKQKHSRGCEECCRRDGPFNGNWKGGRTRNGVRDDNRPENLELWVKPQPSGVRVADAVAWAWEILARYDGLEHLQQGSDEVA